MKLIPQLRKRLEVNPNQVGFLFRDKKLDRQLEPGIYKFFDPGNRVELVCLSTAEQRANVTNQEVLSKDNIAFRFSFSVSYKLTDGKKLLSKLDYGMMAYPFHQLPGNVIAPYFQTRARQLISQIESEEMNEKRNEIENLMPEETPAELAAWGIEILDAKILDLTFPKSVQDLFSRHLEAKIRTKTDLENARTAVATARALKNAAEMMQGDDSIRFFQYMETISKIAAKGKHTFLIGEMPPATKVQG